MNNSEKLRDRIKKSLENASSTIDLKIKIEEEIKKIMSMINEFTDGEIGVEINLNRPKDPYFLDCEKVVFLQKNSVNHLYGFNIIGYSLSANSGYPVSVETESECFDCKNESELGNVIAEIIDKKSLQIVQLMSEKVEDLPF